MNHLLQKNILQTYQKVVGVCVCVCVCVMMIVLLLVLILLEAA